LTVDWESRLVRDPLYGFVGLSENEAQILDTSAMQRLSRIKQLSHTFIVYPSAVHTRLEHSLGALYVAGRVCEQLDLSSRKKETIRAAALLHDVGQGPYSHLFEEPMRWINGDKFSHEDITRSVLEYDPQVRKALGDLRKDVLDLFSRDSLESDVVSGSLDIDKMDYLRRDSHHTGVAYGVFDLERVLRTMCKISEGGRDYLGVHEKGKDAIESYRLARYAMHMQVYEHHARLIADDMFLKAIKAALNEGVLEKEDLKASESEEFVDNFLKWDDHSIQHHILQNSKGNARKLIQDIRNRKLLKRALFVPLTAEGVPHPIRREKIISMTRKQISNVERKIAQELGTESDYVIVHLQSVKIKLYERFEEAIGRKEKPILIQNRDGTVVSLDQVSPISASLTPIRRLYVFCPQEHVTKARIIAENIFNVKSAFRNSRSSYHAQN
jgi:hypothetical protein